jgi:type IV pilus assembly protein PilC
MQSFIYEAKDASGQLVKAQVEAVTIRDAAKLLTSKQLFPLSITPLKSGPSLDSLNRISNKDKVLFTRQLATLVKAGLPIAKSLELLQQQITNPKMLKLVKEISSGVQSGYPLSQALKDHPKIFGTIYISLVEAGEASGNLDETLAQLANQEEKTAAINSKIKSAFTYPIVVLVVLLAVFVMMIVLVLPQVANMYKDLKTPLPPLTQALLAIANTFKKFYYLFFLAFAGIAYGVRAFILTPRGKYLTDTAKIRVPVVKVLVMKLYMSRFSRTLGSLVASGVPVLQALNITSRSMNNVRMETAVNEVTEQVKSGVAMSVPISDNPMFLTLVGQMIGVGEQTGTLGDSLNKVASYYEDEVDEAVKNISTLIEPATMVVLGGLVAFLIAAVLLPIYGLVSSIK